MPLVPPVTHSKHAYERANTIALKNEIAALLGPYGDIGVEYWKTLQDFMQARVTREELILALKTLVKGIPKGSRTRVIHNHVYIEDEESKGGPRSSSSPGRGVAPDDKTGSAADGGPSSAAGGRKSEPPEGPVVLVDTRRFFLQKHNTFLLALLYNTTQLQGPPAGQRHVGWLRKRRGDADRIQTAFGQKRRRFVKDVIARLGRRDRELLKASSGAERLKGRAGLPWTGETVAQNSLVPSTRQNVLVHSTGLPMNTVMALAAKKQQGIALPYPVDFIINDYKGCMASAETCLDSRRLPGTDVLRDRMALVAYESGLPYGVSGTAAEFVEHALNIYLQSVLSAVVDLSSEVSSCSSSLLSNGRSGSQSPMDVDDEEQSPKTPESGSEITLSHLSHAIDRRKNLAPYPHVAALEKAHVLGPFYDQLEESDVPDFYATQPSLFRDATPSLSSGYHPDVPPPSEFRREADPLPFADAEMDADDDERGLTEVVDVAQLLSGVI